MINRILRSFALILIVLLCIVKVSKADDISITDQLKKIPALKTGIAYSVLDSKFNVISTLQVATYKNFNFEVGYAGDSDATDHKLVGVVSYKLIDAGSLNFPILKYVEFNPGVYLGAGRIDIGNASTRKGNNEFDFGVSATLINIKF